MILLDTHVALWTLDDNPRLGPLARQAINAASEVFVSAASVWELTIKSMLGKARIPARFTQRLTDDGFTVLEVTGHHAEYLREFPQLAKHDPFDRLILAQAAYERLQLLTADGILLRLGLPFLTDATR